MQKIFITGVAGFLGSHLAKTLLMKGYKVGGCDTLIGGYISNVPHNVEYSTCDILDNPKLASIMKGYDIVIHTAALAYEGLSVFSPKTITENIYSGTVSVGSAAIQNNIKLILNCSSMARYGNLIPPFKESDTCKPEDPYGLAKLQAEEMLNLLSDIHNIKVVHVVPHNIIGTHQKYDDPFRNVLSIFINRLLQGSSIIIYGDGSQKRSFSYVKDCIEPMIMLLDDSIPNKSVWNIGPDDNEISIKDLAYKTAHHCAIYPAINFLPDRPREVKEAWCDSTKAKEYLKYIPSANMDTIIQEMVSWIKGQGTKPFTYHLPLEIVRENTPATWTKKLY